jgi:hypothetical protein
VDNASPIRCLDINTRYSNHTIERFLCSNQWIACADKIDTLKARSSCVEERRAECRCSCTLHQWLSPVVFVRFLPQHHAFGHMDDRSSNSVMSWPVIFRHHMAWQILYNNDDDGISGHWIIISSLFPRWYIDDIIILIYEYSDLTWCTVCRFLCVVSRLLVVALF